jgi:hypothetical protein
MSYEDNSSKDDDSVDVEELVLPLKQTTSGLSSARQLVDTTSSTEISFDSTA